jgi:hypothetical protein
VSWGRIGEEAAVGPQADQHRRGNRAYPLRQVRRVVARIEDEQRYSSVSGQVLGEALHLLDRDRIGVFPRMHPTHIERGGPAVPGEAQLGEPLVRPAGHDRLSGRVAGGMVIKAAIGTGLGVTARPDAEVNGVDRGTSGEGLAHQQRPQGYHVDAPCAQRVVEAAPAASVCGVQTEGGQRGERIAREQGVAKLEEGIGTALETVMQGGAQGAQAREVIGGHAAQRARMSSSWLTRPTALHLGLHHKLRR